MRYCFLALGLFYLSACGHTPPPAPTAAGEKAVAAPLPGKHTTCKQNEDTRILEVRTKNDGSCDLFYTKFGSEKSVATGGKGYCDKVSERIKTNLARSGFSCE